MYQLFLFVIINLILLPLNATSLKSLSLIEKPKYADNFDHFDYVNPNAPKGGILHLSEQIIFDSLNPLILKGVPAPGLNFFHATLFEPSEDEPASYYPYIADSFKIDEAQKTITFHLNKSAKFSDDSPLTSDDVIASFELLTKKGHPKFKTYYQDIEGVQKIDDHTVKFNIKNDNIAISAAALCELPILSKKYYDCHPFDETSLTRPPTSGPYIIDTVDAGQRIIYKRIQNWWGKDLPSQKGRHNFETIDYTIYRDDTARFEAFKKGSIDLRQEIGFQNWAVNYDFDAVIQKRIKKLILPNHDPKPTTGITINTRKPYLKDLKVRKALNLMFDFYWTNEHLFYNLSKRNNTYFPMSPLASEGKRTTEILKILEPFKDTLPEEVYKENVEEVIYKTPEEKREIYKNAKNLLKEAGFEIKHQKMVDTKTQKPLQLTFLIESPRIEKIALSYAQNLKQIGIEVIIKKVDRQQYIGLIETFDFDLCFDQSFTLYPQSLTPNKELTIYFGSKDVNQKGSINYAGIENPVVDTLINQILNEKVYKKKVELCKALDFLLLHGYYRILAWSFDGLMVAIWDSIEGIDQCAPYPKNFIARLWHK